MVELATLLGTTKSDAEYQSFRQSQALRESLARTEAELADVRRQLADKQAELDLAHASVSDREQAIVKRLLRLEEPQPMWEGPGWEVMFLFKLGWLETSHIILSPPPIPLTVKDQLSNKFNQCKRGVLFQKVNSASKALSVKAAFKTISTLADSRAV
eukprot:1159891-Pelagomonas_calceolata.AAC.7